MLNIPAIHPLLEQALGFDIFKSGSDFTRQARPYGSWQEISRVQNRAHEVVKRRTDPGSPTIEYKREIDTTIQYSLVFDPTDTTAGNKINNLERLLSQDNFIRELNNLNTAFLLTSGPDETFYNIDGFTDKQYILTIRYTHADIWSNQEGDYIESSTPAIVPAPPEL